MQRVDHSLPRHDVLASHPSLHWALSGPGHAVQFYENDNYLRDVVVGFLADGLRSGQPVVSIATPVHGKLFAAGLAACGFNVKALQETAELSLIDAHEVLDRVMVGGAPDPERFRQVVGGSIDRAGGRRRVVRAYGEMVDVLWKQSDVSGALTLERLWNALGAAYHFALLCSYSIDNFMGGEHVAAFEDVCGQHQRVIPTDGRAASQYSAR